jgi:indoleamine 2,3-dioxygenase
MLRKTVISDLPDYVAEIKKVDPEDARLNTALFRDFTMLGASYLLEPCHISYLKSESYGSGMDHLPENLAVPMKMLADRLNYKQPLLDYAQAYALYNWKLVNDPNPENPHYHNDDIVKSWEDPLGNIELIRKFHGGIDEHGFILLHVAIVSKTYKQTQAYDKIYAGV